MNIYPLGSLDPRIPARRQPRCLGDSVTGGYEEFGQLQSMVPLVARLAAKTLVFDVEPLVAAWDSDQEALDRGIAGVLEQVTAIPGVLTVCFATNSSRQPSVVPDSPGVQVEFIASAAKPLRTTPYQRFPRPGVVIGDQVLTDGLLARRLGYTFLHYSPALAGMPRGPQLLRRLGGPFRPLVFGRYSGTGPRQTVRNARRRRHGTTGYRE
jgi:predicted HAD superfamily phosphohydrolase YqeG